jgi:AcrR family transcriptional regulator
MQKLDPRKKEAIARAAARYFGRLPFHQVRLDDVAAAARVGKGTLYLYFKDKNDLYLSLSRDAFTGMVERLAGELRPSAGAWERIERVVRALVRFAFDHPAFFELMRAAGAQAKPKALADSRREIVTMVETALRDAIALGEARDPRPALTAAMVPSLVRAAMLFGPSGLGEEDVVAHILLILRHGVGAKERKA